MNEDEQIQLAQYERGQRLLHEAEEQAEAEYYYAEQTKAYIAELEAEIERLKAENQTWQNLVTTDRKWFREDAERYRKWKENGLSYSNGLYQLEIYRYNPDGVELLTADEVADAARERE